MLKKIFSKLGQALVEGNYKIVRQNLNNYNLTPNNVKRFWKNFDNNGSIESISFERNVGGVITFKYNNAFLEVYEFLKMTNEFVFICHKYVKKQLVKNTEIYLQEIPTVFVLKIEVEGYKTLEIKHINAGPLVEIQDNINYFLNN